MKASFCDRETKEYISVWDLARTIVGFLVREQESCLDRGGIHMKNHHRGFLF